MAFITIRYDPGDVREDPESLAYKSFPFEQPLPLSRSGDTDRETKRSLDIGEGETAILPIFRRYRMANQTHLLQVSAGRWAMDENEGHICNLFLNGAKEYDFEITLVADNVPPIIDQYRFNLQKADLLEIGEKSDSA